MRWVRPEVHLIAQTKINKRAAIDWLSGLGVSESRIGEIIPGDETKTGGESLIEMAGRRCYKSFEIGMNPNVTRIRKEIAEYVDNILKVGHGSVIEHASFTFAIENVSRVFTGEMNRHRAGFAISEGSMRFIRFDDIPVCEVPSLRVTEAYSGRELEQRKETRRIIQNIVAAIEIAYKDLVDNVWSKELSPDSKFYNKKNVTSMLRRIVPMGVATGGVWTGNLRALRHVCTMRCAESAEEEICEVANLILSSMQKAEPNFFIDFKKNKGGYWEPEYKKV